MLTGLGAKNSRGDGESAGKRVGRRRIKGHHDVLRARAGLDVAIERARVEVTRDVADLGDAVAIRDRLGKAAIAAQS